MLKLLSLPLLLLTLGLSTGANAAAAPAPDQDAFRSGCLKQSPGKTAMCGCLATEAMSKADPALRADLILSMAHPDQYTAKAKRGGISPDEMTRWIKFASDSAAKCGVDD